MKILKGIDNIDVARPVNNLQGIEEKFTNLIDNLFVWIGVKTHGDELLIRKT